MERMKTGTIVLIVLLACLSGCAQNGYQTIRPEEYPAVQRMFDLTFGWKTAATDSSLTIDGYVRNNRYYLISDMDMIVSLLDAGGREKASETFSFIPDRLPMDSSSAFRVVLRARPLVGDMIRFQYRYVAEDARDGGFTWRNSFLVPAIEEAGSP
jgi:hypothetical protein